MTTSTQKSNIGIIVILAIALIAAIGYCIYLKTQASASLVNTTTGNSGRVAPRLIFDKFIHPMEDDSAVGDIKAYRNHKGKNDPNMVIYDSSDISNYFSCIWPTLTQTTPPNGYHWAVGFYFVRKYDSTKQDTVLDFYVTPTLVDSTIGHIRHAIDFGTEHDNKLYYQHDPKYPCASHQGALNPQTGSGSDAGNAYDAGELWP
jgi:hypothetical protein